MGALQGGIRNTVHAIAFSPDGKLVVTAGVSGACVWDWDARRIVHTLRGKKPYEQQADIRGAEFSPDGKLFVTGSFDQAVKLWDTSNWQEIDTYWGHKSPILSTAFTADGRFVASGDYVGTVHVRGISDHRDDRVIHGHSNSVNGIACSPDAMRSLR